jgi:2-hydroxychromene-2-carboxylate isomerase
MTPHDFSGLSMPKLTFWYEFASTYSYLSAMRVDDVAREADVELVWQPFLLGPIFAGQGWNTSPFNIYPAKGAYMVRDIDRIAAQRGLAFEMPKSFPANGLPAARLALLGRKDGWIGAFSRAVYSAQFAEQKNIADPAVLTAILTELELDAPRLLAETNDPKVKDQLKHDTNTAKSLGIFGSPSFTAEDGELFWGDDRLEQAVAWAKRL